MSELDFEPVPGQLEIADAEPDYSVEYAEPVPLSPEVVAETQDAMFAQIDEAVSDFQRVTGSWKPDREEWERVKSQLSTLPGYSEHVAETQARARADLHIESFLESVPEAIRSRALQFAHADMQTKVATYGADPNSPALAQEALAYGANRAEAEAKALHDFNDAAHQAARKLGVVGELDVDKARASANGYLPEMASRFPDADRAELTGLAIVAAVAEQAPERSRQLADFWGPALTHANELRAKAAPRPPATPDYRSRPTLKAADIATGRVPRVLPDN